jgi:hypothetical protein
MRQIKVLGKDKESRRCRKEKRNGLHTSESSTIHFTIEEAQFRNIFTILE